MRSEPPRRKSTGELVEEAIRRSKDGAVEEAIRRSKEYEGDWEPRPFDRSRFNPWPEA